jgi:hypothetical protein
VRRFPLLAFAALVIATVAAFFITQHLKVSTPLIAGFPRPYPPAINPRSGITCYDPGTGKQIDHRVMSISFYLLHHSDNVDVWVVDPSGRVVATLATNRFMPGGSRPVRTQFVWNGREPNGLFAPDGRYYVEVRLIHQGRTVTISDNSGPVGFTVKTNSPRPTITAVTPPVISASRLTPVKIAYVGNEHRGGTVLIYRLLPNATPRLVKSFLTPWTGHTATWDGKIRGVPAPVGTYLIRLMVTDAACNIGYSTPAPSTAASNEVVVRG